MENKNEILEITNNELEYGEKKHIYKLLKILKKETLQLIIEMLIIKKDMTSGKIILLLIKKEKEF